MRIHKIAVLVVVVATLGLFARSANAAEPLSPDPSSSSSSSSSSSAPASASDPDQPTTRRETTTITPIAGVGFGSWMSFGVTRAVLGLDVRHPITDGVRGSIVLLLEPGLTNESALGAHRFEGGYALSFGPKWLECSLGVHVAYAMMVRVTKSSPFGKALFGDIGSFGIGPQANLATLVPIRGIPFVFGVRGTFDAYNGGWGYEVAPTIGVRF